MKQRRKKEELWSQCLPGYLSQCPSYQEQLASVSPPRELGNCIVPCSLQPERRPVREGRGPGTERILKKTGVLPRPAR